MWWQERFCARCCGRERPGSGWVCWLRLGRGVTRKNEEWTLGECTTVWKVGGVGEGARDRAGVSLVGEAAWAFWKGMAGNHVSEITLHPGVTGNELWEFQSGQDQIASLIIITGPTVEMPELLTQLQDLSPYHSVRCMCYYFPLLVYDEVEGDRTESLEQVKVAQPMGSRVRFKLTKDDTVLAWGMSPYRV